MIINEPIQTSPKFIYRKSVDSKLRADAQRCIHIIPNAWGWRLANHKLKQAYGIYDKPPVPNIGDVNGNFVCTFSDPISGDYLFMAKGTVTNHA